MSVLNQHFTARIREGRKSLIAFLMAGDGGFDYTLQAAKALVQSGVDVIEVGVPFSDPLADGPVIQSASQRALERGVSLGQTLGWLREIRSELPIPLVLLSYYNPIYQAGLETFVDAASRSGVNGVIIPDLSYEECGELREAIADSPLDYIPLISPTTPMPRLRQIAGIARSFIYAISLTGVTGARDQLWPGLTDFLSRVRTVTPKPLAVGFGISTPEQARLAAGLADGIIVGSAIVKLMEQGDEKGIIDMSKLAFALRQAIDPGN